MTMEMKWVEVHRCTCDTEEHWQVPRLCPERETYHVECPTDPDYKILRWAGLARDSRERVDLPETEEWGRDLDPFEHPIPNGIPKRMQGIATLMRAAGKTVIARYSRGWVMRRMFLNQDESASAERGPVAVRIESISLRSPCGVALWVRREMAPGSGIPYPSDHGWESWQTPEAWGLNSDREICRIKITELRRQLKERIANVAHTEPAP